ncbi:uncharacterized protein LOC142351842 isoform X4 [Convolutriloba macropyga]|uniref:uncharacterized protein LOC142351842 isoform X4 n=1 Tax=Convolutriloba macropyga TaxID=536237 RepID=UPI003F520CD9
MEIAFETFTDDQCACTANNTNNNGPLELCQFPFIVDNTTYYDCSTKPSDSVTVSPPYCATSVDQNGKLVEAGTCSSGIKACQPVCRTDTGAECLFPVEEDGYQYSFCRRPTRNQVRDDENFHQCPIFQGRATADGSFDIEQPLQEKCEQQQCSFAVDCEEFDEFTINGVFFSHQQFDNLNPYPLNDKCNASVFTDNAQNFKVIIRNLGILCREGEDYYQISDGSGSTVFHFCGLGYPDDSTSFEFCLINDGSSNLTMKLLFESGGEKKGERFGFMTDFFATADAGSCPPYEDVTNNQACTTQNGITISSNSTILSYNYPHPYPANLVCTWNIKADPDNPGLYPVLEVTSVNLGQRFDSAVTDVDVIKISDDLQPPVTWSLESTAAELDKPFVFTDRTGEVYFNSSYFFNFHTNFKLNINYLDITNSKQIFKNAGLCLNENATSFCSFPYTENAQTFSTCWRQQADEPASCRNLGGHKISCDMSIEVCLPGIPEFVRGEQSVELVSESIFVIRFRLSDLNWDYVRIVRNGIEIATVSVNANNTQEYIMFDIQLDTFYIVRLYVVSYGRESEDFYSLQFQSSPSQSGVYIFAGNNTFLEVSWDAFVDDTNINYTLQAEPWLKTQTANALIDQTSLSTIEVVTNETLYDMINLFSGIAYNISISGDVNGVETFVFTIGYTDSNPLTENENNLAVRIINGSFFLEGVMTNNTISESIDVEVTRAIEYLRVAARRRRDVNFDDYPSQSLTIVECPVDDCVNSSSYKLQNLDLGPAEPGTLYEFKIHGTNGLLPGRDVKILYATDPDPVTDLVVVEETSSALNLSWVAPAEGQFNEFEVLVLPQSSSPTADNTATNLVVEGTIPGELVTLTVDSLTPGVTYIFDVQTSSYNNTRSSSTRLTTDTIPEPVLSFSALLSVDNPLLVSMNFNPPTANRLGWSGFRIYSWEAYGNGSKNLEQTNISSNRNFTTYEFVTDGQSNYPVEYYKYGTLYIADVHTVSEGRIRESESKELRYTTIPLGVEGFTITHLDDVTLRGSWFLSRANSNFNRFHVVVYDSEPNSNSAGNDRDLIIDEVFDITGQETTGVFELNISTHPEVRSFDIEVVTQVSYPQYDILGSSDTALFVIVPDLPEIVSYDPSLTKIRAYINITAFGDNATFVANLETEAGSAVLNVSVDASSCSANLSFCPVEFTDLEPETNYIATVSVTYTTAPYKRTYLGEVASTAPLPGDFRKTAVNATSYSLTVTFENLPFGAADGEIVEYTLIMAESSGASNFVADNIVNSSYGKIYTFEKFWADYVGDRNPFQVAPILPYPMTFNENSSNKSWSVDIGVDICDVTAQNTACNGPLFPLKDYKLWIAGLTSSGHAILSVEISDGLTTIGDGIAEPDIVDKSLTAFEAQFDPVLPPEASYDIVVRPSGFFDVAFSVTINGSSCNPLCTVNVTGLKPATTYDLKITPTYSGVERNPATSEVTSSLLPDNVVLTQNWELADPSVAFGVTVTGLPFGEDFLVHSYLVIVASADHPTNELTQLPVLKYSDLPIGFASKPATPIPPYLPFVNLTYPPLNAQNGIFSLVIGDQDCSNVTAGEFCNGPLPAGTELKLWLAAYPDGSDPIIRGPYVGFETALSNVSEGTVLESSLTVVTVAVPLDAAGDPIEIRVTDPDGNVLLDLRGITDVNTTVCPQGTTLGYCLINVDALDPNTTYTLQYTIRRTDSSENTSTPLATQALPTMSVNQAGNDELDDPYTSIKLSITGLPFGDDPSITQYIVAVSSAEQKATITFPGLSNWTHSNENGWPAYAPFDTRSYSTLKSDNFEGNWEVILGTDSFPCSGICNGPLDPGTDYTLTIFGLSESGHVIRTETVEPFSTLPIDVEFSVETTLTQIVTNFTYLITNDTGYRIEISENGSRYLTEAFANREACGGSSQNYCIFVAQQVPPNEPSYIYTVCLYVEYTNYDTTHPYDCKEVTVVSPAVKYPQFRIDTTDDIENPYTEVLLMIHGLPFGQDPSITSYVIVFGIDNSQSSSTRMRRSTLEDMLQATATYADAKQSNWSPYQLSPPQPYTPTGFTPGTDNPDTFQWNLTVGSQYPCPDNVPHCNGPLDPGLSFKALLIGFTDEDYNVTSSVFDGFNTISLDTSGADFASGLMASGVEFPDTFPDAQTTFTVERRTLILTSSRVRRQTTVTDPETGESVFTYQVSGSEACGQVQGKCIITVPGLEPGTSYLITITPDVNGVQLNSIQGQITTSSLSDISASLVTNSSEITDVTTQFEARIVGLPFGRDVFVTQYTVIISRNDTAFATNQNPIQYPGSVVEYLTHDPSIDAYQLFVMQTYPPETTNQGGQEDVWFLLVGATPRPSCERVCNGPLTPNTAYTMWFVAQSTFERAGESVTTYLVTRPYSGFYTLSEAPSTTPTAPTEPIVEPQEAEFATASLAPFFIVFAVIFIIILLIILFCCLRRKGRVSARVYPFLRYFSPKPRKTLYAYEHYSQDDSSVTGGSTGSNKDPLSPSFTAASTPHPQARDSPEGVYAGDKSLVMNPGTSFERDHSRPSSMHVPASSPLDFGTDKPDGADYAENPLYPAARPTSLNMATIPSAQLAPLAPPSSYKPHSPSKPLGAPSNIGTPLRFPPKPQQPPPHLKLPPGFRQSMGLQLSPFTPPKDERNFGFVQSGDVASPEPDVVDGDDEDDVPISRPMNLVKPENEQELNSPTAFIDLAAKFS